MRTYQNRKLLVYRSLEAKEADRVFYCLNEQGEKVVILAKGVRKEKSRKAHALDLLNLVNAKLGEFGQSNQGAMALVTEVQLVEDFAKLKKSYPGLIFCQAVCELIGFFAEEGQEDKGIYQNVVALLESARPERYALLLATLILRLLNNAGDLPDLSVDVNSGIKLRSESARYLSQPSGYTQDVSQIAIEPIPDRLYKSQQFMLRGDFTKVQNLSLDLEEEMQLLNIHLSWLQETTERELKTASLFKESLENL